MELQTFLSFLLLTATSANAARFLPKDVKIVGGIPTTIEEVPYAVQLEQGIIFSSSICGGVIIGPDSVLTAGQCVDGVTFESVRFRAGNTNLEGGDYYNATEVYLHPNYTIAGLHADYDIAVVRVDPPFKFGSNIQSIHLGNVAPPPGKQVAISGWGKIIEGPSLPSKVLRTVKVPIVDRETCEVEYDGELVSDNMICAGESIGGKGSCSGDAGDPVVFNNTLIGLVSWSQGCARPYKPEVFTYVLPFVSWIKETLKFKT